MAVSFDAALLAPVPLEHLVSGADVCQKEGKVAFGSMAWQVFRKLDGLRGGLNVLVFLYASHTGEAPTHEVSWRGLYIGHCESVSGAHPDKMRYRPGASAKYADDNAGHWAVFWEVADLHRIAEAERLRLDQLAALESRRQFAKTFRPEGPTLIEYPYR